MDLPRVEFAKVGPENWLDACLLGVREDQLRYVGLFQPVAALGMSRAWARAGGFEHRPFLVVHEGKKAGFFLLSWDPLVEGQVWLYHFFIDHRRQGKGLGKAALAGMPALARTLRPRVDSLHLTVHPENLAAQAAYRAVGFSPSGRILHAEPEWVWTLPSGPS